jgi:hypothetical protein
MMLTLHHTLVDFGIFLIGVSLGFAALVALILST